MKVAVIGAGRIGRVHIENISTGVREMEIKTVADPYMNADGEAFVKSFGIPVITKEKYHALDSSNIYTIHSSSRGHRICKNKGR